MTKANLTAAQEQVVATDYQAGYALRTVALRNQVGVRQVRTVLRDLGIPRRPAYQAGITKGRARPDGAAIIQERAAGDSLDTIAARRGIHVDTVRDYLYRNTGERQGHHHRVDPEVIDQAVKLYADGANMVVAAAQAGTSARTLARHLAARGIRRRPSGWPKGRPRKPQRA